MADEAGEIVLLPRWAPKGRVAVPCPRCERPMWTTSEGYRPLCWDCRQADAHALTPLPEDGSTSPYVPARSRFVGPWFLREPYETTDGRIIRMWCRTVTTGASWYSGIDVVDYAPPAPAADYFGSNERPQ